MYLFLMQKCIKNRPCWVNSVGFLGVSKCIKKNTIISQLCKNVVTLIKSCLGSLSNLEKRLVGEGSKVDDKTPKASNKS